MTTAEPASVAPGTGRPDGDAGGTGRRERIPWLFALMCLLIGLLPGNAVPAGPLKSNGSPTLLIALALFGVCLLGFLTFRRTASWAIRPVVLMILLYFLLNLIVLGVGLTHFDSALVEANKTRAAIWLCASVGIVLYAATRIETERQRAIVLGSLLVGLTFSCFVAVLQNATKIDLHLLFQPPGFVVNTADQGRGAETTLAERFGSLRAFGTAISPIELSVMAAATVPLAIHFARFGSRREVRWLAWLACGVAMLAIPASVSRSGALALVVALMVGMWAFTIRHLVTGVAIGALGLVVVLIVFPSNTQALWKAIVTAQDDASITDRTSDYVRVSQTFHQFPLFGMGLGGSPPSVYGFLDNEWLQALVQGGIVGIVAMTLLAACGVLGVSAALRSARTGSERSQAYTMGAMFVGILASSFTFDLFSFRQAALIFFILIGLLWSRFEVPMPPAPKRRPRRLRAAAPRRLSAGTLLALTLAPVLVCVSCTTPAPAQQFDSAEQRLWPNDTVPAIPDGGDGRPIEVGTKFMTTSDGVITAFRFYQGPNSTGATTATLWSSEGIKLASVPIPEGPAGWREIPFVKPVEVNGDNTYVISYHASTGRYSSDPDTFSWGKTVSSGWLQALDGVFSYGDGFPDQLTNGTNYYVDVVFRSKGPTLREVDGGEDYFDAFTNSFPTTPEFFPLGVWFTNTKLPEEISADQALGINTYVMLTADSDVALIQQSGMHAITDTTNPQSVGQLLADEADMWAGAGDAAWTGQMPPNPVCIPAEAKCGFTVMMDHRGRVPPGVLAYANYGKGVTFWQTREQAERFVNDFQNLVSADNYWFTDAAICRAGEGGALKNNGQAPLPPAECQLAANYGLTTRYVRSLVHPRAATPVWNFVELGHPFPDGEGTLITGPQIRAAVWSSIINGARGIIYFVHSFGGPCQSYNVLRDPCGDAIRTDLAGVNAQIRRLAPILNAPFVDGYAHANGPVDIAVKHHDGSTYIFAGTTVNAPSEATITVSCGAASTVEVIDEGRTLPITNRAFRDFFADGNAVHLYKITGNDGCGLD